MSSSKDKSSKQNKNNESGNQSEVNSGSKKSGNGSSKIVDGGKSSSKNNKNIPAPEIVSEGTIGKTPKRPWESDDEEPNTDQNQEDGEVNEHENPEENQAGKVKVKKAKRVAVLQTQSVVELTKCNHQDIQKFRKYVKSVNLSDEVNERNKLIDSDLHDTILMVLETKYPGDAEGWTEWSDDKFFERLLAACPDEQTSGTIPGGLSVKDRLLALAQKISYSVWHLGRVVDLQQSVKALLKLLDDSELTDVKQEQLVKRFLEDFGKHDGGNKAKKRCITLILEEGRPKTFKELFAKMHKITYDLGDLARKAVALGLLDPAVPEHRELFKNILHKDGGGGKAGDGAKKPISNNNTGGGKQSSATGAAPLCSVCGKPHGGRCLLNDHPDRNRSNTVSWAASRQGKEWAALGHSVLPHNLQLKNGQPAPWSSANAVPFKKGEDNSDNENKTFFATCTDNSADTDFVPCTIRTQGNALTVHTLVDNGALRGDFISRETADWLTSQGFKMCNCSSRVCSGFRNMCSTALGKINFKLFFVNEITNSEESIDITASIIETQFDLIIGRPSIKKYGLADKLRSQFADVVINKETLHGVKNNEDPTTLAIATLSELHSNYIRKQKSELLDYEHDDDGILADPSEAPWDKDDSQPNAVEPLPRIYGSESLQRGIRELCEEFKDIFSTSLRPEPALIPPMELNVDLDKWRDRKNSRPARLQTKAKQYETLRQVNKMLANNVITKSQATAYSQVLLTPKPNDKWRFCIDFRELNLLCKSMGWPIPNIKQMLQRIGDHRSEIFGVMDLTSGYHQAPLSLMAQAICAFITFCGVFEWLRVPMGLKGAPSYFQQMMVTVVLVGLVYIICEVYLDDIIIHAKTDLEFLERLRQVFQRFRKHRMTANPEKCDFGLPEIEYVGHVLDKNGLSFSKKKLSQVLDFPKPIYQKELKSFLGLANYFRDHVENHSTLVRPLNQMLLGYSKHSKLVWTSELEQVFEDTKTKVGNCPKLFFIDDTAPIFLHTDASDYGIGAYLFQIMDDKEVPIQFISKSLVEGQLNWSTPEKEAFAIFYAFQELEYLIRDCHFVLRTDHKNLIFINEDGSQKVKRWKLAIQEYDFDIEHIPGRDNGVADAFS